MIRIEAGRERKRKVPQGAALGVPDRESGGLGVVARAERFIVENPAVALSIALALGVTFGWYFKRTTTGEA